MIAFDDTRYRTLQVEFMVRKWQDYGRIMARKWQNYGRYKTNQQKKSSHKNIVLPIYKNYA
jgi:hypothetical protein